MTDPQQWGAKIDEYFQLIDDAAKRQGRIDSLAAEFREAKITLPGMGRKKPRSDKGKPRARKTKAQEEGNGVREA